MDFSKNFRSLRRLLEKDAKFDFEESFWFAYEEIKSKLVVAPSMATPDWNKGFEIMYDANDYAIRVVLRQRTQQYTMPAKPSMMHKRIIQLQKKRC